MKLYKYSGTIEEFAVERGRMHMLDTYCVTDFYRIYEEYLRQSRKSELFKSLWLPIIVSLVTTLTVNALQWLWPLLSRWFSNSLV